MIRIDLEIGIQIGAGPSEIGSQLGRVVDADSRDEEIGCQQVSGVVVGIDGGIVQIGRLAVAVGGAGMGRYVIHVADQNYVTQTGIRPTQVLAADVGSQLSVGVADIRHGYHFNIVPFGPTGLDVVQQVVVGDVVVSDDVEKAVFVDPPDVARHWTAALAVELRGPRPGYGATHPSCPLPRGI